MKQQPHVIIWDNAESPPDFRNGNKIIVFWQSYSTHALPEAVSIPRRVEEHANSLRDRYLAWIYEVGETVIRGKRLVDHLQLRPEFSAWWMSLLVEKCNFAKSPQIDDAVRLLAFSDLMRARSAECVVLVSSNAALASCLRRWCNQKRINFDWRRCNTDKAISDSRLRRLYGKFPHALQALIWLAHQIKSRWALRGAGLHAWRQNQSQITFVSYLFNLAPEAASQGVFESGYWGNLPEALRKDGVKANWLHLYVKDGLLPTARNAAEQISRFNQTGAGVQNHVTLDSFLSVAVISKVFRDWFFLLRKGIKLRMSEQMPKLGELNLWPLFKDDWNNSLSGIAAMDNVLSLNLFEAAFSDTSKQRIGVYLHENQGWEFGLRHAWKSNQHGLIVGCAHSTVRYWDLRYFFDPRNYDSGQQNPMPVPDRIAVNGPAALNACLKGGCPAEKLVEVEALRFLYLNQSVDASGGVLMSEGIHEENHTVCKSPGRRLLVLGDYTETHTRVQMQLLSDIVNDLPDGIEITVKPHPACPIKLHDYPRLSFSVSSSPIAELLGHADIVYSSAVTSAAVDAYCAGVPVITVLDQVTLNMSPLRGYAGVLFVNTPAELARALREAAAADRAAPRSIQFFNLDLGLVRWKALLGVTSLQ